jgi:hypothetical protein
VTAVRIETDVTYDAEADRLIGADFLREVDNGWTKSVMLPATRAARLWESLQRFQRPAPYPHPLAGITVEALPGAIDGRPQLVPLDLLLGATPLRNAPAEYREIVQIVCVIDQKDSLAERRPEIGPRDFAVNLFDALARFHGELYGTLTRPGGTSVHRGAVSPAGHLQDPYFLAVPGDLPGVQLRNGQRQDVLHALGLLREAGGKPDDFRSAASAYARLEFLPADVSAMADRAASGAPEELAARLTTAHGPA